MSLRLGSLVAAFLACGCAAAFAQQINVNFSAQCPNGVTAGGPCSSTFAAAGPAQQVTIQTLAGPVVFSGGVLTATETNNLVTASAVYSTASFASGGYQQAITIRLPVAATNFYLQVINGDPYVESYTVSDNASHSSSFTLPPNTASGQQGVAFQTVGTVVTVTTSDPDWDFSIAGISFTVLPSNPVLNAFPGVLNFETSVNSTTPIQQSIAVQDLGGATMPYTATTQSGSSWLTVTPASGSASISAPAIVNVIVNPSGLTVGAYRDVVIISSSAAACPPVAVPGNCTVTGGKAVAQVPVSFFVAQTGPIISVTPSGVTFNVVQGLGTPATQTLTITDKGSANTMVEWSVAPVSGNNVPNAAFLASSNSSGLVMQGSPGTLTLSLNSVAAGLSPGTYYELLAFSDTSSQNSPQYVTAVLNVVPPSSSVLPQISPAGLVFVGIAGQPMLPQQVTINWSAPGEQIFNATSLQPPNENWLSSDSGGAAGADVVATLNVRANGTGLPPGVYTGTVSLSAVSSSAASIAPVLGAINVTMILGSPGGVAGLVEGAAAVKPGAAANPEKVKPATTIPSCTPTGLTLTETGIPNNFTVPAGWPADIVTTMVDNCGNTVEGGAVAANFSNGDPPIALTDQGSGGQYVATWQPTNLNNTVITLSGTSGTLAPATAQIAGVVLPNSAPVLNQGGIVNDFNFLAAGALAPGTVAAAFGANLATSSTGSSPPLPLPNSYQSTQLIVSSQIAPLYYVSQPQLNVEIPAELRPLQQYEAVGVVNGQLTLPVTVTLVAQAPIVDAGSDGTVIAQNANQNYSLVSASNPAHPLDTLVVYLVGMGATNPAVLSGQPAPGLPNLAQTTVQPVVKINNQTATIVYAGLTPTYVGLYQIDFTVPSTVTAGTASLTISQGNATANATTLPIAVP